MSEFPLFITDVTKRLLRIPRRIMRELRMLAQMAWFSVVNRLGNSPVTKPGGPVVSLTTYRKRSQKAHLSIESIAAGYLRPSRMILWIDEAALFHDLPAGIRRLQKRGLEVKFCKNYGPHTKYFPYVESEGTFDKPLVTADDDMFYPRYWLKRLSEANREHPSEINCFWAHVVAFNGFRLASYQLWRQCSSTEPRLSHQAGGVCGVIYPPPFLANLRRAGTGFETCCPRADDLWLHVQALRNGYKVRQIFPRLPYFSFHQIPGTDETTLSHENVSCGDGNDRQIELTYTDMDIRLLLAESGASKSASAGDLVAS